MAIFEALGINSSVFIQLGIFIFTILFLAQVAFKHYADALELRNKKTFGSHEEATELSKQAIELSHKYETRAREVSHQIKTIFDSYRDEANKEYESIVSKARGESQKVLDGARARVTIEINDALVSLKEEAPKISQAITEKLLAKNKVIS